MRMFPEQLNVNTSFEITESLTLDGVERILLSPSVCYLKDEIVQLEKVIEEIVRRYNIYKPIFQIHHQNKKTYETEMVAQSGEIKSQKAIMAWQTEVAKRHPLPEGCQWFICNERDPRFVLACYEVEKC